MAQNSDVTDHGIIIPKVVMGYDGPIYAGAPSPVATYTNGGASTANVPSIEELSKLVREQTEKRDAINQGMVMALRYAMWQSGESAGVWSERLNINFETFLDVLAEKRQPDWYFWEQVKRVFEPMRNKEQAK